MRFIRAVVIACLSADFIVIAGTILLGMPVTLFAEQSGQETWARSDTARRYESQGIAGRCRRGSSWQRPPRA